MIQSTLYFQNTICMVLHIRNFKIKSVLIMEFVKWQIKIRNYGLGHTIPPKYNVQGGSCEK